MKKLYCEACEAPLPAHRGRGQPQRFCSDACRKAAQRRRTDGGCEYCGAPVEGNGRYCADLCYYHGYQGIVPFGKRDLHAYNEELIPIIPRGQILSHEQSSRPAWHAWVYGGADRPGIGGHRAGR